MARAAPTVLLAAPVLAVRLLREASQAAHLRADLGLVANLPAAFRVGLALVVAGLKVRPPNRLRRNKSG